MKKLIVVCLCCLSAACNEGNIGKSVYTIYLKSYISCYVEGDTLRIKSVVHPSGRIECNLWFENERSYEAPEIGGKGVGAAKFLEIAWHNADRTYNRKEGYPTYMGRECYVNNFREIKVVCTNAAWDDLHPAGMPLNDLVMLHFESCAEYVHNGYTGEKRKQIEKPLTELTEQDLDLVWVSRWGDGQYLFFKQLPPPGSYRIEVTIVTTEGKEMTAECEVQI